MKSALPDEFPEETVFDGIGQPSPAEEADSEEKADGGQQTEDSEEKADGAETAEPVILSEATAESKDLPADSAESSEVTQ